MENCSQDVEVVIESKVEDKSRMSDAELLVFFQEVYAVKDKLFGKFSGSEVTKDSKDKLWREVAARCVVLGYVRFSGKSIESLRDNIFGRKKKALKEKMDKAGKTGAKAVVYKPWEKLLQNILNVDSPELKGLPVADGGEHETIEEIAQADMKTKQLSDKISFESPSPGLNRKRHRVEQFEDSLELEKKRLHVECLREELESKKMSNYKQRSELGLPASLTVHFDGRPCTLKNEAALLTEEEDEFTDFY
uniref:Regulatory protein zeste n=2 Tax=Ditylenchus dipsaci TaxID=166011 RepID=A0A915CM28_9BILA